MQVGKCEISVDGIQWQPAEVRKWKRGYSLFLQDKRNIPYQWAVKIFQIRFAEAPQEAA